MYTLSSLIILGSTNYIYDETFYSYKRNSWNAKFYNFPEMPVNRNSCPITNTWFSLLLTN